MIYSSLNLKLSVRQSVGDGGGVVVVVVECFVTQPSLFDTKCWNRVCCSVGTG